MHDPPFTTAVAHHPDADVGPAGVEDVVPVPRAVHERPVRGEDRAAVAAAADVLGGGAPARRHTERRAAVVESLDLPQVVGPVHGPLVHEAVGPDGPSTA